MTARKDGAGNGILGIEVADGGLVFVTLAHGAPDTERASLAVRRAAVRAWNAHNGSRGGRACFLDAVIQADRVIREYRVCS